MAVLVALFAAFTAYDVRYLRSSCTEPCPDRDTLLFQAIIKNDVTFSDDFCDLDYRLQTVASRTHSFSSALACY